MSDVQLMPLGGFGETGAMNCLLYRCGQTAVLVDCGVGFADDYYPGANLIAPDFRVLEEWRSDLKAVVLTHGHEDHLGALGFFLKDFPLPVYGTPFALGIAARKFAEFGINLSSFHEIKPGTSFSIGDFHFKSFAVDHSMPQVVGFLIEAQNKKILHLTDFKLDSHSMLTQNVLTQFKNIGDNGLDLLLLDSTNAFAIGHTNSETEVHQNLGDYFKKIPGRAIVCLFSSNTYRLRSLIDCARATGRKVAITGRSTKLYIDVARATGELNTDGVGIYDVEDIHQFVDSEILVVVTGSQAEGRSVLGRLSKSSFGPFRLREGDTLLMSSKMIPGNEGKILHMLNRISLMGVEIIGEENTPQIHASGHARQDELREVMRLTKPKIFVPFHGEHRLLKKHIELAREEGLAETLLFLNGDILSLTDKGLKRVDVRDIGRRFYADDNTEITPEAIRARRKMAWNGLVAVAFLYSKKQCCWLNEVQVRSLGIFGKDHERALCEELQQVLREMIQKSAQKDRQGFESFIRSLVRKFYAERFDFKPEVVVLINEV